MNRPAHFIAGGITSASAYIYLKKVLNEEPDPIEAMLFGLSGGFIGILPDLLEPATSPHHRSFLHSATFAVLSYLAYRKWILKNLKDDKILILIQSLGLAYYSHLLLDSTTPMGLPVLTQAF